MSLVEVVVAMALMAAIVPIFFPLLMSATRSARALAGQAQTVSQLRISVATIGRELRSALCVYEPAPNGSAGPRLRILTAADNDLYEVTYEVSGANLLRERAGGGFQLAGQGLTGSVNVFRLVSSPRRSVEISISARSTPASPIRDLRTVIAGRNTWRDC